MALVSMPTHLQQHKPMEGNQQMRSFASSSSARSMTGGASGQARSNLMGIEEGVPLHHSPEREEPSDSVGNASIFGMDEMEETVFVAVKKEVSESKPALLWALKNNPTAKKFVIFHVHQPAQMIPILGGWFQATQLTGQQVNSYRQQERDKIDKVLDDYILVCNSNAKVRAETMVIEMDDIAKGIIEMIALHGITRLVMGAAADKYYSKKMKVLKSKTACTVQKEALASCKIWFVCRDKLICTREAILDGYVITQPAMTSPSMRSTQSEPWRSTSFFPEIHYADKLQDFKQRSRSYSDGGSHTGETRGLLPENVGTSTSQRRLNLDESHIGHCDGIPGNYQHVYPYLSTANDEAIGNLGLSSTPKREACGDGSVMSKSVIEPEENTQLSSAEEQLENLTLNDDLYCKLEIAMQEAAKLKDEAHKESGRRRMAEMDLLNAHRKAKASEISYNREVRLRKEIEETLLREKQESEKLKSQRAEVLKALEEAHRQKSALEFQKNESERMVKNLKEKLSTAKHHLNSIQRERDEIQREHNNATRELEDLQRIREEVSSSTCRLPSFSEFTYLELEEATHSFANSQKIGEGGYGSVYKGVLRHSSVAIKMLHPESLQGRSEFHQEVDILSRVRHPNLVTLIGACSESYALVYEFLPNGSLEDRLACKDNTPPLSWQARVRISAEMCSALIFLHSAKPCGVVHGDLKPANILLDANLLSKISDFGISRMLIESTTTTSLCLRTDPKGTLVYMDPEFLLTGELTPRSDIYSFGVILLRLLTGRPALGVVNKVQEAMDKGRLQEILDPKAGEVPFIQAQKLAHLGLKCCEMSRKNRPDLVNEVLRVLEQLKNASSLMASSSLETSEDNSRIPSYFICPISQEVLRDPHVAADGYTYEAKALKGWLESGHDTSPMTNLKLSHKQLVQNIALRSAIEEWQQKMQA